MLQQPFGAFSTAVLRFPKLLVAAVNGPAVGVGVTLLPHCDVVYANGGVAPAPPSCSRDDGERRRRGDTRDEGRVAGKDGASFWTPFFRLAIVPEFCSSVTFPEVMVGVVLRRGVGPSTPATEILNDHYCCGIGLSPLVSRVTASRNVCMSLRSEDTTTVSSCGPSYSEALCGADL